MIHVAVVGLVRWAPNLARTLAPLEGGHPDTLCNLRQERLEHLDPQYPSSRRTGDLDAIIGDPEVDAVVIATPAAKLHALAVTALRAGKNQ